MTDSINYFDVLDTFFCEDECFSTEKGIHNTSIMIPSTVDAFVFIQNLNEQFCYYIMQDSKWWYPTSTTMEFVLNSKKQVLCIVERN